MFKNKALPLMIQGTHSDAGKSAIVTALCRIFAQDGYRTAPFKSQNMALNSYITIDGKEIGRAQGVQAESAGIVATTDMNPILIKPTRENESQIVVHGKPYQNMKATTYRSEFFATGLQLIGEAFERLSSDYERIVIEGAGSPAEINLNDRELVNMRVARLANAPVILVGDIEKGGVFASLVGTLQLLDQGDRDRVIGVVINKFRGDVSLLEPGLKWFEEYTGKPVLGVIPYFHNLNIDAEDSVILNQYSAKRDETKEIDIAVIRYPMISNFTDVDPFFVESDCHVRFIREAKDLGNPDLIILPGSKNTLEDMLFLRESGLEKRIIELSREKNKLIFGVCGGYQMLGEQIDDPFEVESPIGAIQGLGLLPLRTSLTKEKKTTRSEGVMTFLGKRMYVTGYEIHMGETYSNGYIEDVEDTGDETVDNKLDNKLDRRVDNRVDDRVKLGNLIEMNMSGIAWSDGCKTHQENVIGTYFHGIFHNDAFRTELLNQIRYSKDLSWIDIPSIN
jgi:adenosylcobyric acid synthase